MQLDNTGSPKGGIEGLKQQMLLPWFALHHLGHSCPSKIVFLQKAEPTFRQKWCTEKCTVALVGLGEGRALVSALTAPRDTEHRANPSWKLSPANCELPLEVDVWLRHFSRMKNKFVKGLVQVAVGTERCHNRDGATVTRFNKPWGHLSVAGAATVGATLWVRLLENSTGCSLVAFISKHSSHSSRLRRAEWVLHCDLPKVDLASALSWLWEQPGVPCSAGKPNSNTWKTAPIPVPGSVYPGEMCCVTGTEIKVASGFLKFMHLNCTNFSLGGERENMCLGSTD